MVLHIFDLFLWNIWSCGHQNWFQNVSEQNIFVTTDAQSDIIFLWWLNLEVQCKYLPTCFWFNIKGAYQVFFQTSLFINTHTNFVWLQAKFSKFNCVWLFIWLTFPIFSEYKIIGPKSMYNWTKSTIYLIRLINLTTNEIWPFSSVKRFWLLTIRFLK